MAAVINTNISSLNAQRNLTTSQSALSTSIQRLSSGLRINSAKDDAAGLAISERMTTQIRGLNQAARNANDGISLAQTAEGALGEIGNNLQRIRELAVQSRNATNSTEDRAKLQKEVDQLKSEIDRVANDTSFNGIKLLDGSFTSQAFQVGANQGQTISITGIADANKDALGNWTDIARVAATAGPDGGATAATKAMGAFTASAGGDGTSTFTGTFTAGTDTLAVDVTGPVSATTLAAAYVAEGFAADGTGTVNGFSLNLGAATTIEGAITAGSLTVSRADGTNFTYAETEGGTAYGTSGGFNAAPAGATANGAAASFTALTGSAFTINNVNIEVDAAADAETRLTDLAKAINASTAGVTATIEDGALKLSSKDNTKDLVIGGTSAATVLDQTGLATGTTAREDVTGFDAIDISTVDGADSAILAMDAALDAVNNARADLGAVQNRFTSVVANLQTTSENLSASRSRIQDTDFAAETASLTRGQILQQAGTAMLAQANSLPNNVLSLLRG
ncbi:flagellin [Noviherbaspirillum agri]